MNKQIELVEKWLADNDSVSQLELEANAADADAVYAASAAADSFAAYAAVSLAAYAAIAAAYDSYANGDHAANAAAKWVAKYYELVKEEI